MRLARALELTHNIASTPNSIEAIVQVRFAAVFMQAVAFAERASTVVVAGSCWTLTLAVTQGLAGFDFYAFRPAH